MVGYEGETIMTPDVAAAYHEAAHCIVANRLGLRLRSARGSLLLTTGTASTPLDAKRHS
jgi:hypothetical protein